MRFRLAMALAALMGFVLAVPALSLAAGDPAAAKTAKKSQTQTAPAKKQAPQTQTAPAAPAEGQPPEGLVVRENYFLDLPGFDLSTLTPKQKEKFLERVNTELCTCGCPNDTIARCLVNDPKCPVVRGLAEKIFSEVKAGQ